MVFLLLKLFSDVAAKDKSGATTRLHSGPQYWRQSDTERGLLANRLKLIF
jgi:hypothetical protein